MTTVFKDPEVKAAWINNLRSGKFKQGKGKLYNTKTDTYCCLGVLCETLIELGYPIVKKYDTYVTLNDSYTENTTLSADIRRLVFTVDVDATLEYTFHLIGMNDVHSKDFNKIADWIENHM